MANVKGTWLFNDELNLTYNFKEYIVSFKYIDDVFGTETTSDGIHYTSWGEFYYRPINGTVHQVYVRGTGWQDKSARTITILEEPTDEAFKIWLQANATRVDLLKAGTYKWNKTITLPIEPNSIELASSYRFSGVNYLTINGYRVPISFDEISGDYDSFIFANNDTVCWGAYSEDDGGWYYTDETTEDDGSIIGYRLPMDAPETTISGQTVDPAFGTWFIANTNYNAVNVNGDTTPTSISWKLKADYTPITVDPTLPNEELLDLYGYILEVDDESALITCVLSDGSNEFIVGVGTEIVNGTPTPIVIRIDDEELFPLVDTLINEPSDIISTYNDTVTAWLIANTEPADGNNHAIVGPRKFNDTLIPSFIPPSADTLFDVEWRYFDISASFTLGDYNAYAKQIIVGCMNNSGTPLITLFGYIGDIYHQGELLVEDGQFIIYNYSNVVSGGASPWCTQDFADEYGVTQEILQKITILSQPEDEAIARWILTNTTALPTTRRFVKMDLGEVVASGNGKCFRKLIPYDPDVTGWRRFKDDLVPFGSIIIDENSDVDFDHYLELVRQNHMVIDHPQWGELKVSPAYYLDATENGGECELAHIIEWELGDNMVGLPVLAEDLHPSSEHFMNIISCSNETVRQWVITNSFATSEPIGDESIIGTWTFNETIDTFGSTISSSASTILKFTCDGVEYDSMYVSLGEHLNYGDTVVYWFMDMPSGWEDAKYRTITITEGSFDKNFVNWLKANATKQESKVIGTWMFNDVLYGEDVYFPNMEFVSNGQILHSIIGTDGTDGKLYRLDYATSNDGLSGVIGVYSDVNGWYGPQERQIITITKEYPYESFFTWLKANATKIELTSGTWNVNTSVEDFPSCPVNSDYQLNDLYINGSVSFSNVGASSRSSADASNGNLGVYLQGGTYWVVKDGVNNGGIWTFDITKNDPDCPYSIAWRYGNFVDNEWQYTYVDCSAEILTWLKANATKVVEPTESVVGTWVFNNTISSEPPTQSINFTFAVNGSTKNGTRIYTLPGSVATETTHLTYVMDNGIIVRAYAFSSGSWYSDDCKIVDFGDTPQLVSEEFYTWLKANATNVEVEDPTESLITFQIATESYTVTEGTTWTTFIANEGYGRYYRKSIKVNGETVDVVYVYKNNNVYNAVADASGNIVDASDVITAQNYTITVIYADTPITFTIDGGTTTANSGMTWAQWLESDNNNYPDTDYYFVVRSVWFEDKKYDNAVGLNTYVTGMTDYMVLFNANGELVKTTDTIISGHAYVTANATVGG